MRKYRLGTLVVGMVTAMAFLAPLPIAAQGQAHFNVDLRIANMWGHEFAPNDSVVISVEDSEGGPKGQWPIPTDANGNFNFPFGGIVDIIPGDVVFVSDGVTDKDLQVTGLTVDLVDADTNVVEGTATPSTDIWVDVHGSDAGRTVTTDIGGGWSTDFDVLGDGGGSFDLEPGTEGYAAECDADDDCTWREWRVLNPLFQASLTNNGVWGWDFAPDASVSVEIFDSVGGTPLWSNPFPTDGFGSFQVDGGEHGINLVPGTYIEVGDGATLKALELVEVSFDLFDPDTDTIGGTAPALATVLYGGGNEFEGFDGDTTADGSGNWFVDLVAAHGFDLTEDMGANAGVPDDDGDVTVAEPLPPPSFNVDPVNEQIHGSGWLPETEITITVNGVGVPGGPYSTDGNGNFGTGFDPAELDIMGGDLVVVTDGESTKEHTIFVAFSVDDVDPDTDTVTGMADPGADVFVWLHESGTFRHEMADGSGSWTADFSVPGDEPEEQDIFNLEPGVNGAALQCDEDNDCTQIDWRVANPSFQASLTGDWVQGGDFAANSEVTISIYEFFGAVEPQFSENRGTDEWGSFWLDGGEHGWDLVPGTYIEVTDGATTKALELTNLSFDTLDPVTDTIGGGADPLALVGFGVGNEADGRDGEVEADDAGAWFVDLAADPYSFDLTSDMGGQAWVSDEDGDQTVAEPRVAQFQANLVRDWVQGRGFVANGQVTIAIYDGFGGTLLFSENRGTDHQGNFWLDGWELNEQGVDLVPGTYIEVADGETTKTLEMVDLSFDLFDPASDTIGGTAPADTIVGFGVGNDFEGIDGQTMADGAGNWSFDLATEFGFDLTDDMGGGAWVGDEDGDSTQTEPVRPYFQASVTDDWLSGWDFAPNDEVTVDLFDGGTLLDSVFAGTDFGGQWHLDPHEHGLDLEPGMYIEVSDGVTTKELEVVDLTFDVFDVDADVIGGTAPPGSLVNVHGGNEFGGWNAFVEADASGEWSLDVMAEFDVDLDYTMGAQADVADDDRDITTAQPRIPSLDASLSRDRINGWGFGDSVVVEIFDGPGGGLLFASDPIATGPRGNFGINWLDHEVDLVPGVYIVATSSHKELELAPLTFDTLDPATDIAAGTAPPGAWVEVNGGDEFGGFGLGIEADGAGNWSVDLMAEQGYDVTENTGAEARTWDDDGDSTQVEYPPPDVGDRSFFAVITHDLVQGGGFSVDASVTIDVYATAGAAQPDVTVVRPTGPLGQFRADWDQLGYDLIPGNRVVVTDAAGPKELELVSLTYDTFDVATDLAAGTAPAGAVVTLGFFDPTIGFFFRAEVEAVGGAWSVDTMAEGGLALTEDVITDVGAWDDDGDTSMARPAPIADAGSDVSIAEGDAFVGSGSFFDPGFSSAWSATVDYVDPNAPGVEALELDRMEFALFHEYTDDGDHTVEVCVRGNESDTAEGCDEVLVEVTNVAPTVSVGADAAIAEGATFSGGGSFTDPGADTFTATVDYGDGGGEETLALAGTFFTLSHTYADGSDHTVTVCVTDDDGGKGCDSLVVTVSNVAPSVSAGADVSLTEGDTFTRAGSFTDPGADTFTATVDYGDGGGATALTLAGKAFTLSHTYAAAGGYTLEVCVTDDDGGKGCDQVVVSVTAVLGEELVAPTVGLVDVTQGKWYLRNSSGMVTSFFYGNPVDLPIAGDWDGDGDATPGLYRQSDGFFYSRNSNTQGPADFSCFAGDPEDIPIVGDWDGDGDDNLGIYRPSTQTFYLFTITCTGSPLGAAQISFLFGNPGDKPVAGDWDGDGKDEVGLHRESTGFFYWRDSHTTGIADGEIFFGDPNDRFVSGDWGTVDGVDTPAIFRPGDVTFYFRHTLTQGIADSQFAWAGAGSAWLPVSGPFGLG